MITEPTLQKTLKAILHTENAEKRDMHRRRTQKRINISRRIDKKIQHPFMTKAMKKLGIEGSYHFLKRGKNWKHFLQNQKGIHSHHCYSI
jgi:hypothetical protein